jgi:hypothetical protein
LNTGSVAPATVRALKDKGHDDPSCGTVSSEPGARRSVVPLQHIRHNSSGIAIKIQGASVPTASPCLTLRPGSGQASKETSLSAQRSVSGVRGRGSGVSEACFLTPVSCLLNADANASRSVSWRCWRAPMWRAPSLLSGQALGATAG